MSSLVQLIQTLTSKVERLDTNVKENTLTMGSIKEDMEQRLSTMEGKLDAKIATVEEDLKVIKEVDKVGRREVVQSNINREEDSVSKDMVIFINPTLSRCEK